ncbi:Hypothetical protein R9X50_00291500 [Acrodontium crateriforme]|uniref:Ribosome quality control complex subunit 2 n=1 Tax=Acrodontium crateriforme TaxID=150365 RepID=A0AAQ3M803_9PEZI|nr:Hypothetical protein R9X50_00291500 [Acrodontium crateriforme]
MKQRFSSLDVHIIAHELSSSLVTLRLANVYDLSTRIFLLKFAKPEHREQLLIDSGFRCHLTSFARATAAAPSQFVARLRKFLRTRRVTAVSQVGTDRVIEITFSDGAYRLFLEFYAGGNIVLTDNDLTILALLRNVSEGAENEQYRLGLKYDLSMRQNYGGVPPLTKERLRDGLRRAVERQELEAQKPGKKIKKKAGDALRKALAITTTEFPPILIDHALTVTGFDRETLPEQIVNSDELLDKLLESLKEAQSVVQKITSVETTKGYILAKQGKVSSRTENEETAGRDKTRASGLMYDDFHPFKPAHLATDQSITFLEQDGFNKTVDEFFSSIEGQKLESKLQEREEHAKRKLDAAREEQAKRLDGLQQVQELNVRKAQAIEANVERIEEAVEAVNGLLAQGMDWEEVERLIEIEASRRNPVAESIKLPLKLKENIVTLLLSEFDDVEEEEMADETDSEASDSDDDGPASKPTAKIADKRLAVDIDLTASAWSNARQYYDQKRTAAVKQEKTAQASEKALKSTEVKVMADLRKGLKQEKEVLRPVRRQHWFEKFVYFISSDGYLVLAGKDAPQNDLLYRRYLKKGDVYVHADLHGAASVIIKNNPATPEAPIPPTTLGQAGHLAVCTSSAWDSKAGMSAWWVNAEQVSKTAPTGEYLATGGFVIRGKKNFLPPAQLLLGFAVMFVISDESKGRHLKHRLRDASSTAAAPENKDGEMMKESEMVDGDGGDDDDDDEFPDAAHNVDEEDHFPDANDPPREGTISSVVNAEDDDVDDSGDDAASPEPRSNPLQSHHLGPQAQEIAEKDESNDDDGEQDDELDDVTEARSALSIADTESQTPSDQGSKSNGKPASTASKNNQKLKPQVRGKRGKAKKINAKYADQDDEDRELAMKLLGSKKAAEQRQAEEESKAAKAESAEEARLRRKAQHDKAQKEGLEAEEIRRLNMEAGMGNDDHHDESSPLTQLDAMVGTPLPGDEILEIIPICAPWAALGKYKYKVKLQPGPQKKGKALREILGKWNTVVSDPKKIDSRSEDNEKIWPREAELIKGLKEVEVVGIIPVKQVRVMMSGGAGGADKAKGGKGGGKGGRGGKGAKKR